MNRIKMLLPTAIAVGSLTAAGAQAQTTPPTTTTTSADSAAFERARKAFTTNDLATARTEMEKAIATMPEDAEANAWMGFILVKSGDYVKAIPYLEKSLTKKPDAPETCTNLGNALLMKTDKSAEDTERAVTLFEKVVEKRPASADAYFNLGYARARKGDYAGAAAAYKKVTELYNGTDQTFVGQAFLNAGIAYQKAGSLDEAGAALRAGIAKIPGDRNGLVALGAVEIKRKDYAAAIPPLEAARKMEGDNYGVLINLANAYTSTGRDADAAAAYGAAAELPSGASSPVARYNQGVLLQKAGQLDAALAAYDQALTINPSYLDALLNAGFVLFKKGDYAGASARFKKATEADATSAVAWSNLGAACSKQDDTAGAVAAWKKAAQLNTSDAETREFLASALLKQGKDDEALQVYTELSALKPGSAVAKNAMGLAYMKQNKLEEAFQAFQQAISADSTYAQAHNNLGVVYQRRGQIAEAVSEYRKAIAANPALSDARTNLEAIRKDPNLAKFVTAAEKAPASTPTKSTAKTKKTSKSGRR